LYRNKFQFSGVTSTLCRASLADRNPKQIQKSKAETLPSGDF
jgi:hypothetical protein